MEKFIAKKQIGPFGRTVSCFAIMFLFSCFAIPVQPATATFAMAFQEDAEAESLEEEADGKDLESEQKALAKKYKLLEEKLFALHEFEKGTNPARSKLLERAFIQSQEKMTASQMKLIGDLLTKTKLKAAESEQDEVLLQLNALLELLQSEDRGKRVRDDIRRHQEYLKEVERILRLQKSIRGQTEGGVDPKRLANSQNGTANRTEKLADEIRENEEGRESENDGSAASDPEDQEPNDSEKNSKGAQDGEKEQPKDSGKPTDGEAQSDGEESGANGKPNKGESGQGESGQGKSGEGGGAGESQSSDPQENANPTRKRIQAAEQKMREAQAKLEKANRESAVEAMKEAEREMALAKQQLEEILRQLREEEVERTLAMLEGRFRQMLERQVRVYDTTKKLGQVVVEQRGTDFEIRSGKLSTDQSSIAKEAGRALLLLREDGSSVAFPATVDEMHQDMLQVASRLSAAKVGRITVEIEEDIIDTLDYLIKALVKTQQDMERMKQSGQQGGGQAGDKPLVDQLAEIKMLRGLQDRIFRRHRRYAKFLDNPEDMVGDTNDPELQAALLRLAEKQAKLTDIARDIVSEKNK